MLQSSAPGLAARQLQPVEAAWLCWHRLWRIWPHILTVTHTAQAAPLFPIFITTTTKILFRTVVYKDLIIEKWKENSSKIWLHWKIPAVLQFNAAVLSSIFFSSFCISLWNISFYRKMHFFIFFLNMVIFFFPSLFIICWLLFPPMKPPDSDKENAKIFWDRGTAMREKIAFGKSFYWQSRVRDFFFSLYKL